MANEPEKPPVSEAAAASGTASTAHTVKYNAAGWRERARGTFDASPHELAGALYDVKPDEVLTEAEVRKRLKAYGERESPGVDLGS